MTTAAWASVVDHSSDAAFRAWGSEFSAKLAAVGLVQTSDTGQINWATVTRAGTNADAGYEVWRFNDSLQATAPIFMKVYYGTGGTTTNPRIRMQVGTASNGSGTVSGTGSANTDIITPFSSITSTVTNYNSYACLSNGTFWISWKVGANGAATTAGLGFYAIERSTDDTGAPTGDAVSQTWNSGTANSSARTISFLTSTVYGPALAPAFGTVMYLVTSSLVSGVVQIYKTYMVTPRVRPQINMALAIDAELAIGNTVTAQVVGTTSHTYIAAGRATGFSSPTTSFTMIWE